MANGGRRITHCSDKGYPVSSTGPTMAASGQGQPTRPKFQRADGARQLSAEPLHLISEVAQLLRDLGCLRAAPGKKNPGDPGAWTLR